MKLSGFNELMIHACVTEVIRFYWVNDTKIHTCLTEVIRTLKG